MARLGLFEETVHVGVFCGFFEMHVVLCPAGAAALSATATGWLSRCLTLTATMTT